MYTEEIWAVDHSRIIAFFRTQPDATAAESAVAFPGCRVTVTALQPRRLAGMALPQTRVTFKGEDSGVIPVYQRFRLAFLSAGG